MKDTFDNLFAAGTPEVSIIPMMNIESGKPLAEAEMPETLPLLTLRNAILFPETVIPVSIGREKSIKLVNEAYNSNRIIGAVAQIDVHTEDPGPNDIYEIGTLGKIVKIIEMPDDSITAIIQGIKRFRVLEVPITEPYMMARVAYVNDIYPAKLGILNLLDHVAAKFDLNVDRADDFVGAVVDNPEAVLHHVGDDSSGLGLFLRFLCVGGSGEAEKHQARCQDRKEMLHIEILLKEFRIVVVRLLHDMGDNDAPEESGLGPDAILLAELVDGGNFPFVEQDGLAVLAG